MGHLYTRGSKLWISYKGLDGRRVRRATKFVVGQERQARTLLRRVEARTEATKAASPDGPPTVSSYAERWITRRPNRTKDYRGRLKHALPRLGDMLLEEVRPRHIRALVEALRTSHLAPRSQRHVAATLHTMFADAVADEIIENNPCVLRRGDLPGKIDKDPTWRALAVFTREEVEALISDERIPEDRRVLYAVLFLGGGLRFGEAAALRWRMCDATAKPLGRLLIAHSFDVHALREKSVKTEVPRQVPVHPTLASVLAAWKLGGWQRMMGRPPSADDLVIPSREGRNRNGNHGLKRFHQDLERLGLRKRRLHDLRRSFISLALADGARKDILRWVTHGPSGDIMDLYTTLPWTAYCEEVAKLRVGLRQGKLVALPKAVNAREVDGGRDTIPDTVSVTSGIVGEKLAGWTGLEPAPSDVTGRRYNRLNYHPVLLLSGGRNRARTCDSLRVRQVLFRLSYPPCRLGCIPLPAKHSGVK